MRRPQSTHILPYPTLFQSSVDGLRGLAQLHVPPVPGTHQSRPDGVFCAAQSKPLWMLPATLSRRLSMFSAVSGNCSQGQIVADRKSTRLNSSHANISYAVF